MCRPWPASRSPLPPMECPPTTTRHFPPVAADGAAGRNGERGNAWGVWGDGLGERGGKAPERGVEFGSLPLLDTIVITSVRKIKKKSPKKLITKRFFGGQKGKNFWG